MDSFPKPVQRLWLRWAGPLGWAEELHPLTGSRPVALVPIALLVAVLAAVTVGLAAGRDLGASVIPSRESPPIRPALLGGTTGLTVPDRAGSDPRSGDARQAAHHS